MSSSHKRMHRSHQYRQLAEGYRALKSPLAETFSAAAEHYLNSEQSIDWPDKLDEPPTHEAAH